MPTTIQQLENTFNLKYIKTIKWGTSFNESSNGIYIISTNQNKDYLPENDSVSFNEKQICTWFENAPNLTLNGKKAITEDLKKQLEGFWLADESILYIGKAEKQSLSDRISQFYNHKVGKKGSHKGGYWLKLLNNLDELYIHLFATNESHSMEEKLLTHFIENVSEHSKEKLIEKWLFLPFANLQLRSGVIKCHGLKYHCQ
jgi:hypothetical protein